MSDDHLQHRFLRLQRRMRLWVAATALLGLAACIAAIALARYRTLYREHYEFRRFVRPGISADEVIRRFGRPYRIYWTRRAIEQVFSGRGQYRHFDRNVTDPSTFPANFKKVLHYRPHPNRGEFVFIGQDDKVMLVITGTPADD